MNRINHPGIIFPDSPNYEPAGKRAAGKKPHCELEPVDMGWGITTDDLSKKWSVSASSVRQYMHRRNVPYKKTKVPLMGPPIIVWKKAEAMTVLSQYLKPDSIPDGHIKSKDACFLLGISNTTLLRLADRWGLPSTVVKLRERGGLRLNRVYEKKAIEELRRRYTGVFPSLN